VGSGGSPFGAPNTFRGSVAAGARANTGFGSNFGANANGSPRRGFGTQQNQPGFNSPINQRFNRSNQNPFNQDNNSFNQGGQGSFNQNGQGSFTQGMQNQGAFGLGNGNRSSFFDNQPFNNQGFGRGASADPRANSSSGFTGTDADLNDGTQSFDDGDFTDVDSNGSGFQEDAFTPDSNTRFDANDQGSFRGQQFDDDDSTDTGSGEQDRNAVPPLGPGLDHAFRDPSEPVGYQGAATPRVRSGGAATAPGLEHAFRDPSDPIGFHGAASARVRSSGINRTDADQPGEDNSGVQPAASSGSEDDRSFGRQDFNSTESNNNSFNNRPDRALGDAQGFDSSSRTNSAVGNGGGSAQSFSQSNSGRPPVPGFSGTTQGTMSSTATGGQANSSGALGGGISSPNGAAAGGAAQPWSFTNPPPPPTSGNGLWRPGGGVYGAAPPFPSEPPLPPAPGSNLVLKNGPAGAQGGPTGSAGRGNQGAGGRDTTVPNSHNGAYSRRRL
jgi:hypothetical protein